MGRGTTLLVQGQLHGKEGDGGGENDKDGRRSLKDHGRLAGSAKRLDNLGGSCKQEHQLDKHVEDPTGKALLPQLLNPRHAFLRTFPCGLGARNAVRSAMLSTQAFSKGAARSHFHRGAIDGITIRF